MRVDQLRDAANMKSSSRRFLWGKLKAGEDKSENKKLKIHTIPCVQKQVLPEETLLRLKYSFLEIQNGFT